MIPQQTLIYDIETATNGASFQELEKHKLRFFGAYSYQDKQFYLYSHKEKDKIQALIKRHKFLVGFNNKYYDNIILETEGYDLKYKIIIDLLKIIKQREMLIKWKNSVLGYHIKDFSLKTITKTLELVDDDTGKGELDYTILDKKQYTPQDLLKISEYISRDIVITKKLL